MTSEQDRIAFVQARDGPDAAKLWAHQTFRLYRQALRTPYGKAYRRALLLSLLALRQYLRA